MAFIAWDQLVRSHRITQDHTGSHIIIRITVLEVIQFAQDDMNDMNDSKDRDFRTDWISWGLERESRALNTVRIVAYMFLHYMGVWARSIFAL